MTIAISTQQDARRPAELKVRIAAVVVDFRKPRVTADCIKDLLRSPHISIVVVAMNAPLPGQVDDLTRILGNTKCISIDAAAPAAVTIGAIRCVLLHTETNEGYAAALNRGHRFICESKHICSHIWLLNNDLRIPKATIDSMTTEINSDRLDRLIGNYFRDGNEVYRPFQRIFWGPFIWPSSSKKKSQEESLIGASILMSVRRAQQLLPMDEQYFLNFEDTHLCRKYIMSFSKSHPNEAPYLVGGTLDHRLSSTQGAQPHLQTYYYFRNLLRFASTVSRPCLYCNILLAIVVATKAKLRGDSLKHRLIFRAILDYYNEHTGFDMSDKTRKILSEENLKTSYDKNV